MNDPPVGRRPRTRRGSSVVRASAWQHAQDQELTPVGVTPEPDSPVSDAQPVLVPTDELADVGSRVVRGELLDRADHALADSRVKPSEIAEGSWRVRDPPRLLAHAIPNSRLISS